MLPRCDCRGGGAGGRWVPRAEGAGAFGSSGEDARRPSRVGGRGRCGQARRRTPSANPQREPPRRPSALNGATRRCTLPLDFTTLIIVVVAAVLIVKVVLTRRAPATVVAEKLRAGATVVDVRSEAEFRGGGYPRAINVPLQALSGRLQRIPKDRPVVVYCASGSRSAMAARILRKAGYADVSNAGGLHHLP